MIDDLHNDGELPRERSVGEEDNAADFDLFPLGCLDSDISHDGPREKVTLERELIQM